VKHYLISFLLISFFTACKLLEPSEKATIISEKQREQQIKQLIANQQLGNAQDALIAIQANNPKYSEYAKLRKTLQVSISQMEQKTIDDTAQMIRDDQWIKALDTFNSALENLPKSTVLKDQLVEFYRLRNSKAAALQNQLLIIRGESLTKMLPIYQQLVTLSANQESIMKLDSIKQESHLLANQLSQLGIKKFNSGNLAEGNSLIKLSTQLSNDPEIQNIYTTQLHRQIEHGETVLNFLTRGFHSWWLRIFSHSQIIKYAAHITSKFVNR